MRKIIGVDIGATKIAGGVVSDGRVLKRIETRTRADEGTGQFLNDIIWVIGKLADKNDDLKIGIGIAGQINAGKGRIIKSPNMPEFNGLDLMSLLLERLVDWQVEQIKVENDANCFVLTETKLGAGKGFKNIVGLTLGSGIGVGIMIDGRLYKGQGFASEGGHMMLGEKSLEALAAGRAIERCYGGDLSAIDIEKLIEGDVKARECYERAGKYLGMGIVNLINILCPDVIVIGGGLSKSKLLLRLARKEMKKYVFYKDVKCDIVEASLGENAGIVGAGLLTIINN